MFATFSVLDVCKHFLFATFSVLNICKRFLFDVCYIFCSDVCKHSLFATFFALNVCNIFAILSTGFVRIRLSGHRSLFFLFLFGLVFGPILSNICCQSAVAVMLAVPLFMTIKTFASKLIAECPVGHLNRQLDRRFVPNFLFHYLESFDCSNEGEVFVHLF